jgi:hypothetical protein
MIDREAIEKKEKKGKITKKLIVISLEEIYYLSYFLSTRI